MDRTSTKTLHRLLDDGVSDLTIAIDTVYEGNGGGHYDVWEKGKGSKLKIYESSRLI
jgi:hypothetical protein